MTDLTQTIVDMAKTIGEMNERSINTSQDVAQINSKVSKYDERLASAESDIKTAKRVVAWGGSGLVALFTWLFRGHG